MPPAEKSGGGVIKDNIDRGREGMDAGFDKRLADESPLLAF